MRILLIMIILCSSIFSVNAQIHPTVVEFVVDDKRTGLIIEDALINVTVSNMTFLLHTDENGFGYVILENMNSVFEIEVTISHDEYLPYHIFYDMSINGASLFPSLSPIVVSIPISTPSDEGEIPDETSKDWGRLALALLALPVGFYLYRKGSEKDDEK